MNPSLPLPPPCRRRHLINRRPRIGRRQAFPILLLWLLASLLLRLLAKLDFLSTRTNQRRRQFLIDNFCTYLREGGPEAEKIESMSDIQKKKIQTRNLLTAATRRSFRLGSEECALSLQTQAMTGKASILPDHAMAGNYNRHRIRRAGPCNSANCARLADSAGNIRVSARRAARDAAQLFPDAPLKRRRVHVEGKFGVGLPATQAVEDSADPLGHAVRIAPNFRARILAGQSLFERRSVVAQIDGTDPALRG